MHLCELEGKVSGFFMFEKFKTDDNGDEIEGSRVCVSPWNCNMILDQGLNQMATLSTYMDACQVGSGSTPPSPGQTALISRVAGTFTIAANSGTTSSEPPYYAALTRRYRFAEGAAAGNLAEVGVGISGTVVTSLFSRSLIKDSSGNPTTLTILPDESLDVVYQLRYYSPSEDITGVIVATGNIGGTYNYTIRPANVTTFASTNGWFLPSTQRANGPNSNMYAAYNGPIGVITGAPSGTSSGMTAPTQGTYVADSFELSRVITASAAQGNLSGGIRSMLIKLGVGVYQIQFDPPIPKTALDVVQLTLKLSWGRRDDA